MGSPYHDSLPLRTVAAHTGLTPDVIRAWEKRYGVVQPIRGPRGARLYDADDVSRLRLLARVVNAGRAIGDVAGLDSTQLEHLAGSTPKRVATKRAPDNLIISNVLESAARFDPPDIACHLADALAALGASTFVTRVAAPLMCEVGERWRAGSLSIAEEHLITASLRHLIVSLIQNRERRSSPRLLLTTPSGERHEIGLLSVALIALEAGVGVVYLGVGVPALEIAAASKRSGVSVVGIATVCGENRQRAVHEVRMLQRALPSRVEIWLGGHDAREASGLLRGRRLHVVDDLACVGAELERVRAVARPGP